MAQWHGCIIRTLTILDDGTLDLFCLLTFPKQRRKCEILYVIFQHHHPLLSISNVSLTSSSFVLNFNPKIFFSLDVSNIIIYGGPVFVPGFPTGRAFVVPGLCDGMGDGESEFATSSHSCQLKPPKNFVGKYLQQSTVTHLPLLIMILSPPASGTERDLVSARATSRTSAQLLLVSMTISCSAPAF